MSASTLFADVGRTHFICRSCLGGLRAAQSSARTQWRTAKTASITAVPVRRIGTQSEVRTRPRRAVPTTAGQPTTTATTELNLAELLAAPETKGGASQDHDVTIRFFDQGDDGIIRPVKDDGDPEGNPLNHQVEEQLAELEGQLRKTAKLVKRLETQGSGAKKQAAERLRLRRYAMIRAVERQGDVRGSAELNAAIEAVAISVAGLSVNGRRHVNNLNRLLKPAARQLYESDIEARTISALWSRYGLARTGLAEAWANVPAATWRCLWAVLVEADERINPRRMTHAYYLAKDMQAAGVALSGAQQLLAMEAMFVEGWPVLALDNWKRSAAALGGGAATATAYWELGLRMSALQGDLERAQRAAERLFGEGTGEADPRVLFQLIRGAAAQHDRDVAWAAYRQLRDLLDGQPGGGMQIEDYDEVVACFLSANETEYAFDVFVEMMSAGRRKKRNTTEKPLPMSVANLFFFGKWLKRLIGAGDLDGASRVLQFMGKRGVMPAAVQANGLLGAWLRSGEAAQAAQAEALAWRMIDARRLFVSLRGHRAALQRPTQGVLPVQMQQTKTARWGSGRLDFVPRASLETFSLMALSYKERGLVERSEALWAAFKVCEMGRADAFMLNQLLVAYVEDGRGLDARRLYQRMVREPEGSGGVQPNAHTFITVLRSLDVHRLAAWHRLPDARRAADGRYCRAIVRDVAAAGGGGEESGSEASAPVLGRLVLHGLRKAGDYVGVVVAARNLGSLLGHRFAMTTSVAIELIAGSGGVTGTADAQDPTRDTPAARRRILRASEAVEALLRELREQRGPGGPGDASSARQLHSDLEDVVARFYRAKCPLDDRTFAEEYAAAATAMALPDSRAYPGLARRPL